MTKRSCRQIYKWILCLLAPHIKKTEIWVFFISFRFYGYFRLICQPWRLFIRAQTVVITVAILLSVCNVMENARIRLFQTKNGVGWRAVPVSSTRKLYYVQKNFYDAPKSCLFRNQYSANFNTRSIKNLHS